MMKVELRQIKAMSIHHSRLLIVAILMLIGTGGAQAPTSIFRHNLIVNGSADAGTATKTPAQISGWTDPVGTPEVKAYPSDDKLGAGIPADHGPNFFTAGGADLSKLSQKIDLSGGAAVIDAGGVTFETSAYLGGVGDDDDNSRLTVSFQGQNGEQLASVTVGPVTVDERHKKTATLLRRKIGEVPAKSRTASITLQLAKTHGSTTSATADDLQLILREPVTPQSAIGRNLIANPGAEEGGPWNQRKTIEVPDWCGDGLFTMDNYSPKDEYKPTAPGPSDRGTNYFFGGEDEGSFAWQDVELSQATKLIDDKHEVDYAFSGWLGGIERQADSPTVTAEFFDYDGKSLGMATLGPITPSDRKQQNAFVLRSKSGALPAQAKVARITMRMVRKDGSTNDSAVDNLSLVLTRHQRPNR